MEEEAEGSRKRIREMRNQRRGKEGEGGRWKRKRKGNENIEERGREA